jgi:MFS superfamily sulfate permease-like transporter
MTAVSTPEPTTRDDRGEGPRSRPTPASAADGGDRGAGHLDTSLGATWRADLGAGLVVFLVALPLCLGVALASNAPMLSGIVTGVVGGLLVSRLSGSQLMVSGPAAGLTAIVASAIATLGSFQLFLSAVVVAGALQIVLGVLRAGIIGYFFPNAVIRGMLAAIGLILILKQLPYAFGAGIAGHGGLGADGTAAGESGGMLGDIVQAVGATAPLALAITLVSIGILVAWPKLAPASVRKLMPAPLAAVLFGIALSAAAGAWLPSLALPAEAMVQLPVIAGVGDLRGFLAFPSLAGFADPRVWTIGLTIGLVASLETLLSLEATDKLDPFKRTAPANRELLAQGTGNIVAGLIGGLPMTGVIVRSAANISAGGRTWRASWTHGLFLAVAVVAVPALLNRIPLATLAAILIFTGFKLANPGVLRDALKVGPKSAIPFAVTVAAILATDLLVGIGIGLAVGTLFVLHDSYRNAYSHVLEESADHHRVRITLAEEVTFLNKAAINKALHTLPDDCVVVVDGTRSRHIDHDVLEILHDFRETARAKGITLRLVAIPELRVAAAAH